MKLAALVALLLGLAGALAGAAASPLLPGATYTLNSNGSTSVLARGLFLSGATLELVTSASAEDCVQQLCAQEPLCDAANWCPLQASLEGRLADGQQRGAAPLRAVPPPAQGPPLVPVPLHGRLVARCCPAGLAGLAALVC